MQPINYMANVPSPVENMNNSIGLASNILQLKSMQAQQGQQQVQREQLLQMNADLTKVSQNPTTAAIAQLSIKYPQLSENLKRSNDMLAPEQKQAKIDQASQAYAALLSGDNETAVNLLKGYGEAYRNSGMPQDADAAEKMAEVIDAHPETAKTTGGLYLSALMGPEKFTETFTKLEAERRDKEKAPAELSKAQADAKKAAVDAKFAESDAAADLQKKGWDIYKIQEDVKIAKENNRIAAINANLNRETNDLKRKELSDKLKDAQIGRDQAVRDKVAVVDESRTTIDNTLNTIDRLMANPALNDVIGSAQGSAVVGEALNTLNPFKWNSDDRANAIADIDTLTSQIAITQLKSMKNASPSGASGFGALSEKELDVIVNSLQSMRRRQGEKQFKDNAAEVQRLLLKGRKNLATKYGMPETLPDTPNVNPSPEEIQGLVDKYSR